MAVTIEAFLEALSPCTREQDPAPCVRDVLTKAIRSGLRLPDRFVAPQPGRYARHLLARLPGGATAIAMVWDKGQGTPVHDHAGMWCVEGVLSGRIEVVRYYLEGPEGETVSLRKGETILSGVGEAGALIPPADHHTILNVLEVPSVTIHVYAGEMDWSHVFTPVGDGRYRREEKLLSYTTCDPLKVA